ncbi:hypothetical protein B0H14DRAFT_3097190 [Mycena olivaceomarginata]|nr:hypothetical protein B0H14DRAFT_3097190 [Mycena olivaceomarginata]
MLNRAATNKLLSLIRRCGANLEEFTIRNWEDMNKQWDAASKKCTNFETYEIEVPYKNTLVPFKMHARPLWNWALDLIQDPRLAKCFVWDAVKMHRHNGGSFVRFWNEPWTADAFWELQPNCFPLYIYADKSKLSSFGTQKAHPIVIRVLNIVVGIRNSSEWGGGQVVGELPIRENRLRKFKHAMWHAAFYKLLESIASISKTGVWTTCGDGEKRWLFPCIVILSADYEEAYSAIMTLIRGTAAGSQEAVKKRERALLKRVRSLLKDLGLRKLDNVFWNIANSDPHRAISFDRLHSHHSGLWGDHLFPQLKIHFKELGDRQSAKLDQQFDALPRWRGLNHFKTVTNILCPITGCIRSYLELDVYAGLELHTADTIADGVTRNYNTKISEPMHRPLRDAYHNQTNFKNVQPQILRSMHRRHGRQIYPRAAGDLDQFLDEEDPENLPPTDLEAVGNVVVGSKLPATSFLALETEMKTDTAFTKFRILTLVAGEEIIPYQFLKVFFKSLENWLDDVDFLRCNPCFHGLARYDAALVKTTQGNIFIDGRRHPFALVQALDVWDPPTVHQGPSVEPVSRPPAREGEVRIYFSSLYHSSGALLVPDFEVKGDHIVVDLVDADMYFRIKAMYGDRE